MERTKRRIRGLLNLARDSGATPHERASAQSLAERLLTENSLTEKDLLPRASRRGVPTMPPGQVRIRVGRVVFNFDAT